ncbi:MAG TPA: histidine kinase N-terminal 7TM domain-containing protein [bacterium]|nr:histidine kinase N-terminal 7TM domain-containing protein [bacterium]
MNIQWLKFGVIFLTATINIAIGFIIMKKNNGREKFSRYFSLLCISAFFWSINIAGLSVIKNNSIYKILSNLTYATGTLILINFFMFSVYFLYTVKNKILIVFKALLFILSIITLYILFSDQMVTNIYIENNQISYIPDSTLHLIYGILFSLMLFYAYYILVMKYINSQGINKKRVFIVIFGTMVSFILGFYFDWYLIHINIFKFFWLGPIFILIMNFSIAYLLFKKD